MCQILQVEPKLAAYFSLCYFDLSDSKKDTTPFYKPGWKPVTNFTDDKNTHQLYKFCPAPWRYTEPTSMNVHLLPYGGDGYVAKLGYDAETALKVKQSLEQNHWIDDKSAVVLIEFVVFEPANLLLSNAMIVLEKFATGMRTKRIDVVLQYIFPSSGSTLRRFYQVCILLWSIIILVLVILETVRVFSQGCAYFKRFFNWISFLQLLSSSCAMLLVFLKENGLRNFLQQIRDDPFGSWSAFELVKWTNIEEIVLSITVVITTIKCLKLIQINRHIHIMRWSLQAAYRYLCSFSVIVLILALAFAELGMLLFGSNDEEYATLYYSLSTVLQMAIGIGKLRSKLGGGSSESQMIAPIFLMACMLSMTIVFTDTFIAILDEAYHQANSQEYPGEELGVFMKKYLKDGIKRTLRKPQVRKSFQASVRRKSSAPQFPLREIHPRYMYGTVQQTYKTEYPEAVSLLGYGSSCTKEDHDIEASEMRNDIQTNIEEIGRNISQFLSREIQPKSGDAAFQQQKRARLAETESLLSYQSLSEQEYAERATGINDACNNDVFTNTRTSRLKFPPTKEDLLLNDIKEAMENARLELAQYVWNNGNEYAMSRSSSSFSSSDNGFKEWEDSTSMLSLFGHYQSDDYNNQSSKFVSGRPVENEGNITLNVLRRHGHTYIEMSPESYV